MDIKKRGKFLTAVLIYMLVADVSGVYSLIFHKFILTGVAMTRFSDSFYQVYFAISLIFSFIELLGLWLWKKWAMYLLILHMIVALGFIFIDLINHKYPVPVEILSLFFITLIYGLIYWAIKRKWQYFH